MKQIEILQQRFTFKGDPRSEYFCVDCTTDINLNVQSIQYVRLMPDGKLPKDWQYRFRSTSDIDAIIPSNHTLNGPYVPANDYPTLDTIIPDSMDEGMRSALTNLVKAIGGDTASFVCAKLKMSGDELAKSLKAEQIDGVALAIYNIEARHEGMIIGDQTGVGKGRQAAAVIRYALKQGYLPIFVTQRANLFSDIYRDCKALGIADAKPFILNSNTAVVDFTLKKADYYEPEQEAGESDADFERRLVKAQSNAYEVVYTSSGEVKNLSKDIDLPKEYDYVMVTYSQFSSPTRNKKCEWIMELNKKHKCVFILDEAHTASGANSNTGLFFQNLLKDSYGTLFLSATFAKKPENMALYATKTAIARTRLDASALTVAVTKGGVPMQELLSNFLVENGQMVRRERDMSNISVRYITLDETGNKLYGVPNSSATDTDNSDTVTDIMRGMVCCQRTAFDRNTVKRNYDNIVKDFFADLGEEVPYDFADTSEIKLSPISPLESLFTVVESLLLSVKAKSIAELTIKHISEGKKVVICVSKTKESQIKRSLNDKGEPCKAGDVIDGGFKETLRDVQKNLFWARAEISTSSKGIIDLLKKKSKERLIDITVEGDIDNSDTSKRRPCVCGKRMYCKKFASNASELLYTETDEKIENLNINLPMSPIDYMTYLIDRAGIKVGECTGRQTRLRYTSEDVSHATVENRLKSDVAATFARFQDNELDVMIINQTGATGASCHAVPTAKVPADQVKQRVMIVAQPELNVSTELQKRGRINRTGQLANLPPIYEYISSAIPAEQRMMMMLKRKLKSLDANTSSNQRQNDSMLDYPDFQNKYGDLIVSQIWMQEHADECGCMWLEVPKKNNDFDMNKGMNSNIPICPTNPCPGCANRVSGRIALLSCESQKEFYDSVFNTYDLIVSKEKERGFYDLETSTLDIKGRLVGEPRVINEGDGTDSFFGGKLYANKYEYDTNFEALDFDNAVNKQTEIIKKIDTIVSKFEEYKTAKRAVFKQRQKKDNSGSSDTSDFASSFLSKLEIKSDEELEWERGIRGIAEQIENLTYLKEHPDCTIICKVPGDVAVLTDIKSKSKKWNFDDFYNDIISEWDSAKKGRVEQIGSLVKYGNDNTRIIADWAKENLREQWDEICKRLKNPTYTIIEGNMLLAFIHPNLTDIGGMSCVYFTTADGKTRTGLKLSNAAAQRLDEISCFKEFKVKKSDKDEAQDGSQQVEVTEEVMGELLSELDDNHSIKIFWEDTTGKRNILEVTVTAGKLLKFRLLGGCISYDLFAEFINFGDDYSGDFYSRLQNSGYPQMIERGLGYVALKELRLCCLDRGITLYTYGYEKKTESTPTVTELWPTLDWNRDDIPKSKEPIKLSDKAKEAEEAKRKRAKALRLRLKLKMAMLKWDKSLNGLGDKESKLRNFIMSCLKDGYTYIGANHTKPGLNVYPLTHYSERMDLCVRLSKESINSIINQVLSI